MYAVDLSNIPTWVPFCIPVSYSLNKSACALRYLLAFSAYYCFNYILTWGTIANVIPEPRLPAKYVSFWLSLVHILGFEEQFYNYIIQMAQIPNKMLFPHFHRPVVQVLLATNAYISVPSKDGVLSQKFKSSFTRNNVDCVSGSVCLRNFWPFYMIQILLRSIICSYLGKNLLDCKEEQWSRSGMCFTQEADLVWCASLSQLGVLPCTYYVLSV